MGDNTDVPAVLTIAGSDSSGGAGIQADLKVFTSLGCYGTSVITALTAQNTTGVQGVHSVPPGFVAEQMKSVWTDTPIRAFKTGMLSNVEITQSLVDTLQSLGSSNVGNDGKSLPPLVVDPVCVSTSGHTLLEPSAISTMITSLFPLSTLITPNKSEAELILSYMSSSDSQGSEKKDLRSLDDILHGARRLLSSGPKAVLMKGGHLTTSFADIDAFTSSHPEVSVEKDGILDENMEILLASYAEKDPGNFELVVDVLVEKGGSDVTLFVSKKIESSSTHGTGCTLSAAIVCGLAKGLSVKEAVKHATSYTHQGISAAFPMGSGHGPLNHMHSLIIRTIARPTSSNPHPFTRLLIQSNKAVWKQYVEHDFVRELGKGTLKRESFIHFIKQDYIYLRYYSRAYGLLVAKSSNYAEIAAASTVIQNILNECEMHRAYCAKWGVTLEELEGLEAKESQATTAYGAFIIDMGLQGDASRLAMALAACLLGYGEVGLWLRREARRPNSWVKMDNSNPYLKWMEDYSGEEYQQAVRTGIVRIERMAVEDPPSPKRLQEWVEVWERCTMLEKGFWDMAMSLA